MKHLWEAKHPYHCSWGNYYSNECHQTYNSWESFLDSEGDSDLDYNLVYRWDWDKKEKTLEIFFMGQRKALARSVVIMAMHADEEESVREWLSQRWRHLAALWSPISEAGPCDCDTCKRKP